MLKFNFRKNIPFKFLLSLINNGYKYCFNRPLQLQYQYNFAMLAEILGDICMLFKVDQHCFTKQVYKILV